MGLKGTDGRDTVQRALALGAVPLAGMRAEQALQEIAGGTESLTVLTCSGAMGAAAVSASGLEAKVVAVVPETTASEHTCAAAIELVKEGVDLILFAGGDGTAVDVFAAVGDRAVALGIPSGVKMHSACFASTARSAGRIALDFFSDRSLPVENAEVMDVDEDALRAGHIAPRLHGYLVVPGGARVLPGPKARTGPGDEADLRAVADEVVSRLSDGETLIVGPGTTTKAVMDRLGLEHTLLGVDVVRGNRVLITDAAEGDLLAVLDEASARIVVAPIGGQGFLLGRGNQQISPAVLRRVGREGLLVIATEQKLSSLRGSPLHVDTGDAELDSILGGYVRIVTGRGRETVYRIAA